MEREMGNEKEFVKESSYHALSLLLLLLLSVLILLSLFSLLL